MPHSTHTQKTDSKENTVQNVSNVKNIENTLFHGDSRAVLESLPNNIVDCVVTSPPYWGARDYGIDEQIGFEKSMEQYVNELVSVFTEVKHTLKDSGVMFLCIDDLHQSTAPNTENAVSNLNEKTAESQGSQYRFDSGLPAKSLMGIPERLILSLLDTGWVLRNKIVWVKSNPLPEPSAVDRFRQSWEPIYMFTKESQYEFHCENTSESDVWEFATASHETVHPAPLPVTLCKKCVLSGAPPNGVVLDPFCGSGSTCIAAEKTNREYIGIDVNESYLMETQAKLQSDIVTKNKDVESTNGQQTLSSFD